MLLWCFVGGVCRGVLGWYDRGGMEMVGIDRGIVFGECIFKI